MPTASPPAHEMGSCLRCSTGVYLTDTEEPTVLVVCVMQRLEEMMINANAAET